MITSDDHGGLVKAIRRHMQEVSWQRGQTHFKRNILDSCPKALRGGLKARLKLLFDAADYRSEKKQIKGQAEQAKLLKKFVEKELFTGHLKADSDFDQAFGNWKRQRLHMEADRFAKSWGLNRDVLLKSLDQYSIVKENTIPLYRRNTVGH